MVFLAIDWGSVGLKIAQLLLSLSILVILHEFGHYITAKWFKCRVEKFFLFFDPWFALVKKRVGDTVYGIGWLPLGGYVKIAGMVDESMDKEQMQKPPQPWEFRTKPAWQRLIIMLAGVTVNVILAFLIYTGMLMKWGEDKIPNSGVRDGIWVTDSLMYKIGLRNGDKVISVNGKPIEWFENAPKDILFSGGGTLSITRNGLPENIAIPTKLIGDLVEKKKSRSPLFLQRTPLLVGTIDKADTSNAVKAGLRQGDRIIAVQGTPVKFTDQAVEIFEKNKGQKVNIDVLRGTDTVRLPLQVNKEGRTGLPPLSLEQMDSLGVIKLEHTNYSFAASIPRGVQMAGEKLVDYIQQFKLILRPETGAWKGVGGFKGMASVFSGNQWDWQRFWDMTALFSIILAFMNLLPIPGLDGGHALFIIIEMITGKKPNEKVLEKALIVGFVILIALMLFANINDWFGYGRGK